MVVRLAKFLSRWSGAHGGTGPLIAGAYPDGFAYIAVRLQVWHKLMWVRVVKNPGRRTRFAATGVLDERGHKCKCGSGRWIQNDVDGCMAPGCREYFITGERHGGNARAA